MVSEFALRASVVLSVVACSSNSHDDGSSSANLKPVRCLTGPGTTTLYEGGVSGLAADGDQIVVTSDAIARVALSSGQAVTVLSPQSPYGLLVLRGVAYFTAEQLVGTPDAQGKQSSQSVLESVPVAGGEPTVLPGVAVGNLASTTDDDSLYFDAIPMATVAKLTPPATTPIELALDGKIMIDAIAVHGDYVYVAGQDFADLTSNQNGVIERVSKTGGQAERIVSNIGHPWNLVADETGLYWVQDPPNYGSGSIVRSNLDGSSAKTFVASGARSLALANGRLYFAWDGINSVPTSGGTPTSIASGLTSPGMIVVAGGNVVWVDPTVRTLSDSTVPKVMTACVPDGNP